MILVQILVKDLFNMIKKIFFSSFLLIIMFCGCMTQNEITGSVAKLETVEKVVDDTLPKKSSSLLLGNQRQCIDKAYKSGNRMEKHLLYFR